MKLFFLFLSFPSIAFAQFDSTKVGKMYSMAETHAAYSGSEYKYYVSGSDTPYTGYLCARYNNGELQSVQQFVDGVGNGEWIDFDPDGRISCKGTYVNNKVEGPVTFYYEDGSVKSEGQYRHYKRPIGWWTFYDRDGNVVSRQLYTR